MTKRLVIIGASALGREVCTYARECGMEVRGFLDSRAELLEGRTGYPPVMGPVEGYRPERGDVFVCACGEPAAKRRYTAMLPSVEWATIVHPTAYVGANVKIGEGSVIRPLAAIGNDATVGCHVTVGVHAHVAHDCEIGDYVSVSPGCEMAGWCRLDEGVFMGVGSVLVPRVHLGKDVFVAAGAVVVASSSAPRLMGIPARER